MKQVSEKRGGFTSSMGFILAATGSAVGLGNLWKFPYLAGKNGGAIFLFIYLAFIFILGIPITLGEMAIGRNTKLNPIGAYQKLNKKYTFIGISGVACAFIILCYYSVIGGWVLKYIASYITNATMDDASAYFQNFIQSSAEPVVWHLLFMAMTCLIVVGGVSQGIEKASKIMLPLLFFFIVVLAIRAIFLPGSAEGIKYFLIPNFAAINSFSDFANILLAAMGQVFFSLSLGMGAMITYGSYLQKGANLQKDSTIIASLDSLFAILAGFAILPAVFAFGYEPTAGPGLIFETLPKVFESMPFGGVFGFIFFVLVFFAAITSSVSLLEVVTSFCIDNFKMKRITASILLSVIMGVIGIFAALSFGPLSNVQLFGNTIFDVMSFISDKLLMPFGAFFMCIFIGHVWGVDAISDEITNQNTIAFKWRKLFGIIMKYIAPAIIFIIFITSFIPTK